MQGMKGIGAGYDSPEDCKAFVWPTVTEQAIREIWAAPNTTLQNSAAPATTAPFAAMCWNSLFPSSEKEPLHLLISEYGMTTKRSKKMEPLVDAARARGTPLLALDLHQPSTANFFHGCRLGIYNETEIGTRPSGSVCTLKDRQAVAVPYRPDVDIVLRMFDRRRVPVATMRPVAEWFAGMYPDVAVQPTLLGLRDWISEDGRHATKLAHRQMTVAVVHALYRAHAAAVAMPTRTAVWPPPPPPPPAALSLASSCSVGRLLLDHVQPGTRGWHYVVENHKAGMVSTVAGSTLDLRINGSCAQRTSLLFLSFLQSNAGDVGKAAVSCRGGCACTGLTLDGNDLKPNEKPARGKDLRLALHRTSPAIPLRFAKDPCDSSAAACTVRARMLAERRRNGEPKKFKLTAITLAAPSFAEVLGATMGKASAGYEHLPVAV